MLYESTRGGAQRLGFKEAVLEGLARDGGLLLPLEFPDVSSRLASWRRLDYPDLAREIFAIYTGGDLQGEALESLLHRGFKAFRDPRVAPLRSFGRTHLLELFHGPTWSFKDVALQTLGLLFELWPASHGERTVLGATSGDTGSAAIHGLKGRKGNRVFILFPEGRVSPVQELQMTTVPEANVHCLALRGTFDDCQAVVKELFADVALRDRLSLAAVNSINWSRILSQIVYYFHGYFRFLEASGKKIGAPLLCSVPTGNFGDIFAGYVAKKMGLPLEKLIVATNENDILARFAQSGAYTPRAVVPTSSPSMDIQVSSNFERLLFLLHGRNATPVRQYMDDLKAQGRFTVDPATLAEFRRDFAARRVSEEECHEAIRHFDRDHGCVLDPHGAVGLHAGLAEAGGDDVMVLATAHPGKFPAAVERALGRKIELPAEFKALEKLPRRKQVLPADAAAVRAVLLENAAG